MEQQGGFAVGLADRWRPAMVPAVATGLVLLERVLMDELGSPMTLLRALGDLGQPWTDPVASVLAVMALTPRCWSATSWSCLCSGRWAGLPK